MTPLRIALFGATGSIGRNVRAVAKKYPERFRIVAVGGHNSTEALEEAARETGAERVVVTGSAEPKGGQALLRGREGLEEVASAGGVDVVFVATAGVTGIFPTLAALKAGKRVALANKETLVSFGPVVKKALEGGGELIPVDSEHSALFQLADGRRDQIKQFILTASGGPFRSLTAEELDCVTVEDALAHPTWNMGAKITIDSATLMNKGLELIEARWLFDAEPSELSVVVHPGSTVHALVRLADGMLLAHLGWPDMKAPIQYALTYPERLPSDVKPLDLVAISPLEFLPPDTERFPCLRIAMECMERGGQYACAMNGANEAAVAAFLEGKLEFTGIPRVVEEALSADYPREETLEALLETDRLSRMHAEEALSRLA